MKERTRYRVSCEAPSLGSVGDFGDVGRRRCRCYMARLSVVGDPARPVVTAAPRPAASVPTPVPREGGASCSLPSGSHSITLSDTTPVPTITVPVGTSFTVVVPPGGEVLPVKVTDLAALNERCTASLTDTGRRTVLSLRVRDRWAYLRLSLRQPKPLCPPGMGRSSSRMALNRARTPSTRWADGHRGAEVSQPPCLRG
jgi:hypothetical protein